MQSFVYRETSCYRFNLNHAVIVVGYLIAGKDKSGFLPPYWIIRNSWGKQWGDGGYMRMGITGGDGICGINVLPGVYPVVNSKSGDGHLHAMPADVTPGRTSFAQGEAWKWHTEKRVVNGNV